MKNQLLNLKLIALVCLMMVLGGANVWAADKITDVANIVSGGKYYIGATTSNGDDWYLKIDGTSKASGIKGVATKSISEGAIFVIEKNGNSWNLKFDGTNNYLALNSDNAKLDVVSTAKAFTFANKKGHIYMTSKVDSETRCLRRHNTAGTQNFGSYSIKSSCLDVWIMPATPAKTLTSLAISSRPTKTTYNVGEEFDPTGLVVTGTYDDNTTATITNGITWTKNPEKMSLGNTSCTVTASVGGVKSEPFEVNGLKVVRTISLSIDPTTSTVVKAPVNVTLTATEGATVYYTTNGEEPTINSEKYNAPFEVTHSGTTVKALAVADGADDVKAEATYTIKPDQPVFSDESKTFKDAFNVTLSLPKTTDATSSKIYYEIGGTATEESKLYEGPITISAEKDGEKVILHAVVVDEYGNIGKEKYCTYTKISAIVFDFTANPNVWGITPGSNGLTGNNVIAGKKLEVDGVVMTATNGDNNGTCIYKTNNNKGQLRVYSGGSITFTAPSGFNLSNINFAGSSLDDFTSNEETYTCTTSTGSAATWNGNAHAVTFSASSGVKVNTATIKLVAVEPVQPTSVKINLKAHDSEGYHYATFSSDKNVVLKGEDVYVYGVSVSNGKVSMNELNTASYNVTDATVGSMKGYYVPANTGVLIKGFNATSTYYFPAEAQTVTLPANYLKPAPANGGVFEAADGYKYYKLAYDNFDKQEGLGFYWGAPEGGAFYVKAGTAYLAVHAGEATAKGFAFNGEATGIEGVNANVENAKAIYNLNGQRVASMAKPGLYIVNGKKVVRK